MLLQGDFVVAWDFDHVATIVLVVAAHLVPLCIYFFGLFLPHSSLTYFNRSPQSVLLPHPSPEHNPHIPPPFPTDATLCSCSPNTFHVPCTILFPPIEAEFPAPCPYSIVQPLPATTALSCRELSRELERTRLSPRWRTGQVGGVDLVARRGSVVGVEGGVLGSGSRKDFAHVLFRFEENRLL